ncbi:restriction endonuclease subunit S [Streptomyces bottropensis]|uniref:Restriction endonuclease subunit S n=1 Tax=Streptomyces bottropensis TaxID=42235 RepID=A0ABU8AKX4_9ACTN|nr:restriction endonuclease subunit S [Streptomyces bottropensis]MZD21220.1 restriction endonuclease subunit S [Streptomyces sp. SID5476]
MTGFVPLKRVARIRYGLGQPPPLSEEGIPIIRATNVFRGKISAENLLRANLQDLPLDRAPLLHEGEILVVRSGAYTGDSARITSEWVGSAPGYDLRVTPHTVDSRFAAYALLSTVALDQIKLASTRAAQPHLNAEELGEIGMWLPSTEEQRRIADFLDAETARIDRLDKDGQKLLGLLSERRQAVIDHEVDASSRSLTKLFWKLSVLRDGTHQPPPRVDLGVPLLTARNVSSGELRLTDLDTHVSEDDAKLLEKSLRMMAGDVLLSVKGTIGACAIAPTGFPRSVLDRNVALLRPLPDYSSEWLAFVLRSTGLQDQMRISVTAAAQPGLPLGVIRELRVPDVSLHEQEDRVDRISARRQEIDQVVDRVKRKGSLLSEHRQALITAAVTGQFDVSTASGRNVTDGVTA